MHGSSCLTLAGWVVATPLAAMTVEAWEETNRPAHLMAESSGRGATELHEEQKYLFKQYGRFDIVTGSVFYHSFDHNKSA